MPKSLFRFAALALVVVDVALLPEPILCFAAPALGLVKDAVTPCARQLFASVGYGEGPAAVIASFERGVLVLLGLSAWVRIVRDFAQCP
jgi:hypothetical protein